MSTAADIRIALDLPDEEAQALAAFASATICCFCATDQNVRFIFFDAANPLVFTSIALSNSRQMPRARLT